MEPVYEKLRSYEDFPDDWIINEENESDEEFAEEGDWEDIMAGYEDSDNVSSSESIADSTVDILTGLGWIGCLAHGVQLVINSCIKDDGVVTDLLRIVNDVILVFRRSPKWTAEYRKEVKISCTCDIKKTHDLVSPNATRWNSTFYALQRLSMVC